MHQFRLSRLGSLLVVAGALAVQTPASAEVVDLGLGTRIAGDTPAGAAPWVNLSLLDLGFVAGSGFDGVKNTVELQISVTPTLQPTPFTAEDLEGFGLSAYPTTGQVIGKGDLTGDEYVSAIYMNVSSALDLSKLELAWTGPMGFPIAGVAPASIAISQNGFSAGSAGLYDILISFDPGALSASSQISSKLLFTYDGGATDIDPSDFVVGGSFYAVATVWDTTGPAGVSFIGAPVPEPETWAMLGVGLAALALAKGRRRKH
ncbi:MAG: PEP-CTERM sorting domain-containing protein [Burkholderiales bacterium]|nr:PEP-CTERM sorting domain-containing protein [Burkholderiales bacterium]